MIMLYIDYYDIRFSTVYLCIYTALKQMYIPVGLATIDHYKCLFNRL